jgi:hypothetical protein
MKIALFEGFAGVAGDMWVGALLDAGVPLAPLVEAVRSLPLPGVELVATKVLRGGLTGTHFRVLEGGQVADASGFYLPTNAPRAPLQVGSGTGHLHRGLREIEAILNAGTLPAPVRAHCLQIYRAIGEVEAAAHGVDLDTVHFHEVGAVDTIVDVVCACLGTHLLGVDRIYASGIVTGFGTVTAAHGELPVPAPATAALLRGIPVRRGRWPGECTTPTGAALLRCLVDEFEPDLTYTTTAIGYGAGTRNPAERPNLLRLVLGETAPTPDAASLWELECQVDTATGEQLGWLLDELLRRGALDAMAAPVLMKKGRPGHWLVVLCHGEHQAALSQLLLEESTSLGVRRHRIEREILERWQELRPSPYGPVQWKVARLPSGQLLARPEDEELRRLAATTGLGRAELLRHLTTLVP